MKLRYPAAFLVVVSTLSGLTYLFLWFQYADLDLGWEFDEHTRRMHHLQLRAGWTWFVSATLLTLLLLYRWFIKPSTNLWQEARGYRKQRRKSLKN